MLTAVTGNISRRVSCQMPLWLLALLAITSADCARILAFFPIPTPSHQFVFRPVLEELARRGHEVVYYTAYPYSVPPINITQVDLSMYDINNDYENFDFIGFGELDVHSYTVEMYKYGLIMARYYLPSKEVQELIHSAQKFDAVLFESYFYQEYSSAFIHKFNAVAIEVVTLGDCAWVNELAGLPDNPAYQLDFKSALTGEMNFWERLYNVYVSATTTLSSYYYLHYVMQPVMDKYFNYTGCESRPPLDVLVRNRSLILANFDPLFGYPYPLPPNRKEIGGINIRPNRPLPEDLQSFMDESTYGVIYMSLGSVMDPAAIKNQMNSFMAVFKVLPQRVLLKFEKEFLSEIPRNVKISTWFPQQDVLAHRNCVLFITHGGLLSIAEATYHGVPLVGVPIFADQAKNMVFAESEGFGRLLRYRNITRETVSWTVREVLSNERYKKEAVRRSKIFKDRRHTPAEEAAYWIEHSLKYPFSLTPKSASLSPIQLHMIDIKIFISSVLFTLLYTIFQIIKSVLRASIKQKQKQL